MNRTGLEKLNRWLMVVPSVKLTARLEKIASKLGHTVVASSAFAVALAAARVWHQ